MIEDQQYYDSLSGVENCDLYDYLRAASAPWDFTLLLSVAHHWENGYAGSGVPVYSESRIHELFARLQALTRIGIYLEMPFAEPGFDVDYTDGFMKKYCRRFNIIEINRTIATNGVMRRLYFLDIAGVNRNPVAEQILRNAHLYEKMETKRLTISRAAAFVASTRN